MVSGPVVVEGPGAQLLRHPLLLQLPSLLFPDQILRVSVISVSGELKEFTWLVRSVTLGIFGSEMLGMYLNEDREFRLLVQYVYVGTL